MNRSILLKRIAAGAGILLGSILAGFLLLCLVFLLPTDKMAARQSLSADIMYQEGSHYQVIHGVISSTTDNYTDGQMMNIAIFDAGTSLVDRVLNAYRAEYHMKNHPELCFANYVRGEAGYDQIEYPRYWHGYLLFLKPLMMIFNYAEIRLTYMILQTALYIWVVLLLYKRSKPVYMLPFLTAVVCLMPLAAALSLQYSSVLYISLSACLIILYQHEKLLNKNWYPLMFLIIGILTSYFDFLTYPMITLGMPLTFFYCILKRQEKPVKEVVRIIGYSVSWGIGYLGMWMGKWLLSDFILNQGIIRESINTILYRASQYEDVRGGKTISYIDMLVKNVKILMEKPYLLCGGIVFIYLIYRIIKNKTWEIHKIKAMIPFGFICMMPFAWYMISCNHSYIHAYMTYRELVIAVFAGLCMLAQAGEKETCI